MTLKLLAMAAVTAAVMATASLTSATDPPANATSQPESATTQPQPQVIQNREDFLRNMEQQRKFELVEIESRIQHLQLEIPQVTGLFDGSADSLHQEGAKLNDDLTSTQLDYIAGQARLDAITAQIADVQTRSSKAVSDSPVLAEMQKVVDARQSELIRQEKLGQNNVTTQSALDAAAGAVADAKAQLLIEQDRIAAASGGDLMADLQKQLVDTTIVQRERAARIKELQAKRDKFIEATRLCDQLTTLQSEAQPIRQELAHIQDELDELNIAQEMSLQQPK